ncbi:MAG: hypothetical protein H8E33_02450 [Candidatus Cloacimonetes bacterium]|nr:hypothetical protein [Candidatus Cloacimonadota bacterium]MBL7107708.1 hypothetical protein [Candidatus Cloacimonadota bacterium]
MKKQDKEEIVILCKIRNTMQLDAISEILDENDILFGFKRKGLSIARYFAASDSNIEIYVHKNDKEKAYELIKLILKTLDIG